MLINCSLKRIFIFDVNFYEGVATFFWLQRPMAYLFDALPNFLINMKNSFRRDGGK